MRAIFGGDQIYYLIDGNAPNWISTDLRGAFLLSQVNGKKTLSDLSRIYGEVYRLEASKALSHVETFLSNAERRGMISTEPFVSASYPGREFFLKKPSLKEFWIHTNNSCNLTCTHCLVSSSAGGDPGLSGPKIKQVIDEAVDLGALRFYFTGGEPFVRKDIFDLIRYVTEIKGRELIILTNAMLFAGERLAELKTLNRQRVRLQISLDGSKRRMHFDELLRDIGTTDELPTLERIYTRMESLNVSRDLFEKSPNELLLVPVIDTGWCDWGQEERILSTLQGHETLYHVHVSKLYPEEARGVGKREKSPSGQSEDQQN